MVIPAEWTDPDTLELDPTDYYTSAIHNSILGMLLFLAEPPRTAVRLTASQGVVGDGTDHTILWNEATWSDSGDAMWDALAPSKVVITRDGTYLIPISTEWAASIPTDDLTITLEVNGTVRDKARGDTLVIDTNLAVGDELEVIVTQASGAAVNLLSTLTRMTVRWSGQPPPNDSETP